MATDDQPEHSAGFDDPDYYLLREFELQLGQLEAHIFRLRGEVLNKLQAGHSRKVAQLKALKSECRQLNQAVKKLEAAGNTSIVAQSDLMELVKPLAAMEGQIAELEIERDALKECMQQLKREKREAAATAQAVKAAQRKFNQKR